MIVDGDTTGTATTLAGPRSPQLETLSRLFAEVLGVDRFGVTDNFFAAGGNSVAVIRLVGRIRTTFGVSLGPDTVFRNPTVLAIAEHLDMDGEGGDALDPLLALRPHGSRPPLFCVHPGGGMSWCYAALLGSLDTDRPLYGLQARGLRPGGSPAAGGVAEMVEDYLGLIREVQPDGPYHLLGWSFGGTVAHALACRIQAAGDAVGLLATIDAEPTSTVDHGVPTARELMVSLLQEFGYELRDLANVPLRHDRVMALLRKEGSAMAYLPESHVDSVIAIFANNQRAVHGHAPGHYPGDLHFFSAADESAIDAAVWTPYVGGDIHTHLVAGTHRSVVRPEQMARIARVLNELLA
jgi:thioesterase domain-containing protein/acyl carrier protein